MSSTHMKITIALRRVSTPIVPIVKSTAESANDSASIGASPASDHHGADDGHEQQNARELECEQVLVEQRLGNAAHRAKVADGDRIVATARRERLREPSPGEDHHL